MILWMEALLIKIQLYAKQINNSFYQHNNNRIYNNYLLKQMKIKKKKWEMVIIKMVQKMAK